MKILRSVAGALVLLVTIGLSGYAATIDVKTRGAIGDGASHPLSTAYATLAEAQAVYPFITSLSQEIDYAAFKQSSDDALGPDGMEHGSASPGLNVPISIPGGTYIFGNDTWRIRNASGIEISGSGTTSTILRSTATVLAFDGLWYSSIHDMQLQSTTAGAIAAVDLDGNVPGHPYPTRSVQFVQLENVLITGGGSTYALAVCRLGGSSAQCSSLNYVNMALSNASFAPYFQNGYNALTNVWTGGDIQNYPKHGIYLFAGSIQVYGVSFESTRGYTQIVNDGYDVDVSSGGVYDGITLYGCRSESLRFVRGGFSQFVDVRAFTHNPAMGGWSAGTTLPLYATVEKFDTDGFSNLYVVTTPGTTGATEPTWTPSGTVTDGSTVWTLTYYTAVDISAGSIDIASSRLGSSAYYNAQDSKYNRTIEVTTPSFQLWHGITTDANISGILVYPDIPAADVTVRIAVVALRPSTTGRTMVVKRANADAHAVTITGAVDGNVTLAGGTTAAATFMLMGGGAGQAGWFLVSRTN